MKFPVWLLCAVSPLLLTSRSFSQGSLTPPAAPTPTMKSLDQIEPRTPISSLPYTISTPGSYYLTKNLTASGSGAGITVSADNVTIDLNGFALIGGGSGSVAGITVPAAQQSLGVRNGTVSGWTDGGISADNASGANASGSLYEKLRLANNTSSVSSVGALQTGAGSTIKDCQLYNNGCTYSIKGGTDNTVANCTVLINGGGYGIYVGPTSTVLGSSVENNGSALGTYGIFALDHSSVLQCAAHNFSSGITINLAGTVAHCTSAGNIGAGIIAVFDGALISDCVAGNNGNGIVVQNASTVSHCTVNGNGGQGIGVGDGSTVSDCTASNNSNGIIVGNGSTVRGCTARANSMGIRATSGNQIVGNTCDANNSSASSSSAGIYLLGSGNRIDSNSITANGYAGLVAPSGAGTGANIIIRNTFSGTAYILNSTGNTYGPFVDMHSGGGQIASTSPWANFYY